MAENDNAGSEEYSSIFEYVMNKKMTRRQAISNIAKAAIGVAAAAALGGGLGAYFLSQRQTTPRNVSLTWFLYVGANQGVVEKQVINDYMNSHPGVKVTIYQGSNVATYPKMVQAKNLNQPPVVNAGYMNAPTIAQGVIDKMWLPLNLNNIPNSSDLFQNFMRSDNLGLISLLPAIGFSINTKVIQPPYPTSWADLFSDRYVGKLAYWNGTWYHLLMAAILNGGSIDNIQPGIELWKRWAKNIGVVFNSNAELQNLIQQNEVGVVMGYFPSNTAVFAQAGLPVKFIVPKEGLIAFPVYNCVVYGSTDEQKRVAEDIINLLVSPQTQANIAEVTFVAPANRKAWDLLSAQTKSLIGYTPDDVANMIQIDWLKYAANSAQWAQLWNTEVAPLIGKS